jgi:dTDP-4-dehydrorhamnose reductase
MRVAVIGSQGQLGRQLVNAFLAAKCAVTALSSPTFDITDPKAHQRLGELELDVVVNSAAWTDVDGCARDPQRALRVNGEAPGALADAAASIGAAFIQISTNEVFDGKLERPYLESDKPNPLNPYAESKLLGERLVATANSRHLIIRTAWLFGPAGLNFVTKILEAARRARVHGDSLRVVNDEWGNPTWTPALAASIVAAVRLETKGILHLAGTPATTRYGWASDCCRAARVDVPLEPILAREYPRASRVPLRAVLDVRLSNQLGVAVGEWRGASDAYAGE